jgi:hypothetical protein
MNNEKFMDIVRWAESLTEELYEYYALTYIRWFKDDSYGDGRFAEWRRNQIAAVMFAMVLGRPKKISQS